MFDAGHDAEGVWEVAPPAEGTEDVVAYAVDTVIAMCLSPGDSVRNDVLCTLLGLPKDAHVTGRTGGWLQFMTGDEGVPMRLAEAGIYTRPGAARLTVMGPAEAREFYRERGMRRAIAALERDMGYIRTIKPENAEESKRINDDLARGGVAVQQVRSAMDRRRKHGAWLDSLRSRKDVTGK